MPAPPAPSRTSAARYGDFSGAALGPGAALHGAISFHADNAWNTDISGAALDPNSDALIASIGLNVGLHPDFGAGLYNGATIGIPYIVVAGTQARVAVNWTAYGDESDPGPYPVPATAPVEGAPDTVGDRHVLVIDRDHNRIFELDRAFLNSDGSWNADCGAVFHLDSNIMRPTAQPGCRSSQVWRAMKRPCSGPAAFFMRCASRCSIRAAPTSRRQIMPHRAAPAPVCRPWACACA